MDPPAIEEEETGNYIVVDLEDVKQHCLAKDLEILRRQWQEPVTTRHRVFQPGSKKRKYSEQKSEAEIDRDLLEYQMDGCVNIWKSFSQVKVDRIRKFLVGKGLRVQKLGPRDKLEQLVKRYFELKARKTIPILIRSALEEAMGTIWPNTKGVSMDVSGPRRETFRKAKALEKKKARYSQEPEEAATSSHVFSTLAPESPRPAKEIENHSLAYPSPDSLFENILEGFHSGSPTAESTIEGTEDLHGPELTTVEPHSPVSGSKVSWDEYEEYLAGKELRKDEDGDEEGEEMGEDFQQMLSDVHACLERRGDEPEEEETEELDEDSQHMMKELEACFEDPAAESSEESEEE